MPASKRPKWIAAVIALVLLVLGAAAPVSSRLGFTLAYPDPGATMTPVPRTPRPTRTPAPSATVTGTIVPTPTPDAYGLRVYEGGSDNCTDRYNRSDPEVWTDNYVGGDGDFLTSEAVLCNFDDVAKTVCVGVLDNGLTGYSYSWTNSMLCPLGLCDNPSDWVWSPENEVVGGQTCIFSAHKDFLEHEEGSYHCAALYPIHFVGPTEYNQVTYTINGGYGDGKCPYGWAYDGWEVWVPDGVWQPTPGPTATLNPAPDAGDDAWITEILTHAHKDWNLRSGVGVDDQFVEVGAYPLTSIAGYTMTVVSSVPALSCQYTFKADNEINRIKVIYADEMLDSAGTGACGGFPLTGTAYLANADGVQVDARPFETPAEGNSWAATSCTDPTGFWWSYPPSPGYCGYYWPTVTPTP